MATENLGHIKGGLMQERHLEMALLCVVLQNEHWQVGEQNQNWCMGVFLALPTPKHHSSAVRAHSGTFLHCAVFPGHLSQGQHQHGLGWEGCSTIYRQTASCLA